MTKNKSIDRQYEPQSPRKCYDRGWDILTPMAKTVEKQAVNHRISQCEAGVKTGNTKTMTFLIISGHNHNHIANASPSRLTTIS